MENLIKIPLFSFMFFSIAGFDAQHSPKNYLTLQGPIQIDHEDYFLVWSSNPSDGYYKQEYLRTSDKLEEFDKMVLIEVVEKGLSVSKAIEAKVQEIILRKKFDPVAHYQLLENESTGEYLLDFVFHENGIYEWSAYRYKKYNDDGVLLLAFTMRSFDNGEIPPTEFLTFLKSGREKKIDQIIELDLAIRLR